MSTNMVSIVRTGVANVASVAAAFERCGVSVCDATNRNDVRHARLLVLPGVGSFGAGMAALESGGLIDALIDRVAAGRPTLAICLGLQLLCVSSRESPGVSGLGIIGAPVEALSDPPVPRFGWNRVVPGPDFDACDEGYAYYANSYGLRTAPRGWSFAMSELEAPFVGALQRGGVLACQFHPELSGPWGLGVLKRWIAREAS